MAAKWVRKQHELQRTASKVEHRAKSKVYSASKDVCMCPPGKCICKDIFAASKGVKRGRKNY